MFKIKQVDFYDLETDNHYREVENGKPKYVDFNEEPILYKTALLIAQDELKGMFEDCKNYTEAKERLSQFYEVQDSGRVYCDMIVAWGNDEKGTIEWDVRWY